MTENTTPEDTVPEETTPAEAHTLIGAYVLDAVSDAERLLFEEHLAGCPSCVREVDELRETSALLGGSAAVEPPAELRARVLAAVARTRQRPPRTDRRPDGGDRGRSARQAGWPRRVAAAAAAAGIAAAVALGVQAVDANRRMERHLQAIEQADDQSARIARLLAAPDATLVRGEVTGGGTGTAVASPAKGEVLFLAQGLPRLPADRAYQLWLIGADGPRSAGLLSAADGQPSPLLASGFTGREAVGLTVEPRAGSVLPTTPTVVVLPLV
ncbi:anti-sigma factor [Actinokineospora iranica]|uniref:Regulator of SigK n=1 Tax=Actinokineospora iranica TaxID=1271860 RepID=A0A1G6KS65_9PSEU|nr:anti-sigma factor [Actinokineospora iranica]SDC33794.1 Putative zinc-finger [Actinokineospora iranica]